jgi:hypothetical protein
MRRDPNLKFEALDVNGDGFSVPGNLAADEDLLEKVACLSSFAAIFDHALKHLARSIIVGRQKWQGRNGQD